MDVMTPIILTVDASGRTSVLAAPSLPTQARTRIDGVPLNDTALTGEQREYIDVLTSSARSLLRVVDDILDYSEVETGKLALESEPFHLHRCIGDTVRLLAPAARVVTANGSHA